MLDQAVTHMREDVSKMRQAAAQVLQPLFLTPALAASEWVEHVCPWQVLFLGSVLGCHAQQPVAARRQQADLRHLSRSECAGLGR